jgi:hypothetical protein
MSFAARPFLVWALGALVAADAISVSAVVAFGQPESSAIESARSAKINVVRTGDTSSQVTVDYATVNGTASGSDYVSKSGKLTFPAGATSRTISVSLLNDTTAEGLETVRLALLNPSGAALGTPCTTTIPSSTGRCCGRGSAFRSR